MTARRYVWHEAKRRTNLAKHGLDFIDAWRVIEARGCLTLETTRKGEARFQAIAAVAPWDLILSAAYVERDGLTRVLSLRRASRRERTMLDVWTQEGRKQGH